ncbi:MAG: universal stress protein [Nakamurella sp.]
MSVDREASDAGRIAVGVDGSVPSRHALRWARFLAETMGSTVTAVAAWQPRRVMSTRTCRPIGIPRVTRRRLSSQPSTRCSVRTVRLLWSFWCARAIHRRCCSS